MDDKIFFSVLTYLFIAVVVSGFLPSYVYTGTSHDVVDNQEFKDTINAKESDLTSTTNQLSFFAKILTFLFVTWTIDGLPGIISAFIIFINLISYTVVTIYIYDKIRGIGS